MYSARNHRREILRITRETILSGIYLGGNQNSRLVRTLNERLPRGFVIPVGSGHDALSLALASLHLSRTDEILFPVNAYPTAFPVCMSGAKAVPVDVDEQGLINVLALKRAITSRTKAIVIVHMYGLVVPLKEIYEVLARKKIYIIEDCAQSFGSMYTDNRPTGTAGDIGCFSFYPTKNVGTYGDGGAVWTKHKHVATYINQAISYGEKSRYKSEFVSGHSRIPEIQAAILNVNFRFFHRDRMKKQSVLNIYLKALRDTTLARYVRLLYTETGGMPMMHVLACEAEKRDALRLYLSQHGIETLIHYPSPIHMLRAFLYLDYKKGDFPVSERLAKRVVSLPFHASLTSKQIHYVIKILRRFYGIV